MFQANVPADEIAAWLPRVQSLFALRWATAYTSSPWVTPEGFAPFGAALSQLAATGEASLSVLAHGDELLAFSYNLHAGRRFCYFQHATDDRPEFRKFSLGKVFLAKLLTTLVSDGRHTVFDFMVGEDAYKLEWADCIQRVYVLVERRPRDGVVAFAARYLRARARVAVVRSPRLKALLRKVIGLWRLRTA
jgi:CelD/BcsL family acetyltransferase involved in cellulose biosynthesis